MFIKITNARQYTWYENKLNRLYEVKGNLTKDFLTTHYVTIDTENTSWPLYIDVKDCEVIYDNHRF